MSNVYQFRKAAEPITINDSSNEKPAAQVKAGNWMLADGSKTVIRRAIHIFHTILVLMWPFAKWLLGLFVALKMVAMIYHWNEPGTYAGWQFIGSFALLVLMTFAVNSYRPRNS